MRELPESPVTVLGSYDESIARAHALLRSWQDTELAWYSPNWAPLVEPQIAGGRMRSLPNVHQRFLQLLDGKRSIRDLALKTGKDLLALAKVLSAYRRQNFIGLQAVGDRASPFPPPPPAPSLFQQLSLESSRPAQVPAPPLAPKDDRLILCIDDSEHICFVMEEILRGAGYRVATVQEAVEAASTVLRQRPDFIFLDLIMPVVNGYELCKQLRRVSIFKSIPIVILSGNDGMVDRVRAKMVGATDFLSKPIDEAQVLKAVRHYLPALAPPHPRNGYAELLVG